MAAARSRPVGSTAAPFLVVLLAAALDVAQWLRNRPLWLDEEMIALNVRDRAFTDLAGALWLDQSAPLGWLVAMRAAILSLGTEERVLRFLPLLFGLATIVTAAWIGTRWMRRPSALLLVLLCALGQWLSHFRFEVKHYSADAFATLLLPALVVWAVEAPPDRTRTRIVIWWLAAATAQWFSIGAILVTPACGLFLLGWILRRRGIPDALHAALAGVIWLAAFSAHYDLSLKYTQADPYLQAYWADGMPPEGAGAAGAVRWIAARLSPLGSNPGGATLPILLWSCAALGLMVSPKRAVGVAFATVPLSALVLAAVRVVPLHDRLALWVVPALYVGVALLFDAGLRVAIRSWKRRRWVRLAVSVGMLAAAAFASADILAQGRRNLDLDAPRDSNHALDDRGAIGWLAGHRRGGDALLSTRQGWPAIWWYAGISIGRPRPAGRLEDGTVMYRVSHESGVCDDQLREILLAHDRVLVYVGFPDVHERFFDLLLQRLSAHGRVAESRRFADLSRAAIVERAARPAPLPGAVPLPGCIALSTARRW